MRGNYTDAESRETGSWGQLEGWLTQWMGTGPGLCPGAMLRLQFHSLGPPPHFSEALGTAPPHQGGVRAGRCPAARTAQRGLFHVLAIQGQFYLNIEVRSLGMLILEEKLAGREFQVCRQRLRLHRKRRRRQNPVR